MFLCLLFLPGLSASVFCLSMSMSLSVCMCVCLSVTLCRPVCPSVFVSVCSLASVSVIVSQFVCLPVCQSCFSPFLPRLSSLLAEDKVQSLLDRRDDCNIPLCLYLLHTVDCDITIGGKSGPPCSVRCRAGTWTEELVRERVCIPTGDRQTGPGVAWAMVSTFGTPCSTPSRDHLKECRFVIACAIPIMCRWGNLRSRGLIFEFLSSGGKAAAEPPQFKFCPGLSQQEGPIERVCHRNRQPTSLGERVGASWRPSSPERMQGGTNPV